jgi:hypothetical protein
MNLPARRSVQAPAVECRRIAHVRIAKIEPTSDFDERGGLEFGSLPEFPPALVPNAIDLAHPRARSIDAASRHTVRRISMHPRASQKAIRLGEGDE